jgi:hypothetical protein
VCGELHGLAQLPQKKYKVASVGTGGEKVACAIKAGGQAAWAGTTGGKIVLHGTKFL